MRQNALARPASARAAALCSIAALWLGACTGEDKVGPYGEYDFDLIVGGGVSCQDGHYNGLLRDNGADSGAPSDKVTVLVWKVGQAAPEARADIENVEGKFAVDLDAEAIGAPCEAVDTVVLFLPRGDDTFGDPVDVRPVGAATGGGFASMAEGADISLTVSDEFEIGSASAYYYDLSADKGGDETTLSADSPGEWHGSGGAVYDGTLVGCAARDTGGKIVGAVAF